MEARENSAVLAEVPARLHALAEGVRSLSDLLFRRYFALLPLPRSVGVEQEDEPAPLPGLA